jgi:hypothetical protein
LADLTCGLRFVILVLRQARQRRLFPVWGQAALFCALRLQPKAPVINKIDNQL